MYFVYFSQELSETKISLWGQLVHAPEEKDVYGNAEVNDFNLQFLWEYHFASAEISLSIVLKKAKILKQDFTFYYPKTHLILFD